MKVALVGYGRMGRTVEKFALLRGNRIVARIDKENQPDFDSEAFRSADVAIEFSTGACAVENIRKCIERGVPVVCGTTGWYSAACRAEFESLLQAKGVSLMFSPNYSIGVNIVKTINRLLARIMDRLPSYKASVLETHHIQKLDHPSGTAISLSDDIVGAVGRYSSWAETTAGAELPGEEIVEIRCTREGQNPGYHRISWKSEVDEIAVEHQAFSRDGFAEGAVVAAEWILSQPKGGFYDMQDMLKSLF